MNRIARWLENRHQKRVDRYMAKIRRGTPEGRKAFLEASIVRAYVPLFFAMRTLQAKKFIEGTIQEQTTGEWFRIEMRKIDPPGTQNASAPLNNQP